MEWVALFQPPVLLVVAAFSSGVSSLTHALEEVQGEGGPLWEYFDRLAGVRLPSVFRELTALGICLALPLASTILAMVGYLGDSSLALSILAGLRIGDSIFSHGLPAIRREGRPNPGMWSAGYFAVEGALLVVAARVYWLPIVAGAVPFALVYLYVASVRRTNTKGRQSSGSKKH